MLTNLFASRVADSSRAASGSRLGYLPGLDGLRALAVLAVIFYHADVVWLTGGYLGVEVFFVVSGYLITSLLLAEYRKENSINLKQFWQRRARRLLPAAFTLVLAVAVYAILFLPDEVASLRGDIASAFGYVTNWYLIAAQKSYFEDIGRPSLLKHLWSLAVEEQFYVFFPLLFALVLTRLKERGAMWLLLLGAAASAIWMGLLYTPDADPSRVYYGTDTRAAGLLIGAALAFAWKPRASDTLKRGRRWLLDAVGLAALGGLIAAVLLLSEFDPFLYQGGFLLVAAATALVIAAVVHPQSPLLAPLLSIGVLRWIGLRSYSLYLWHFPVFMLTRPQVDTTLDGVPLLAFRLGVTLALAELSYRVIETPIRSGALGKAWNTWRLARGIRRWGLTGLGLGVGVSATAGLVLLASALWNAQAPQAPNLVLTPDEEVVSAENNAPPSEQVVLGQANAAVSDNLTPVSLLLNPDEGTNNAAGSNSPMQPEDGWLRQYREQRSFSLWSVPLPWPALANNTAVSSTVALCDSGCQQREEFLALVQAMREPPTAPTVPAAPVAPRGQGLGASAQAEVARPPRASAERVFAIGDSVMLGASLYLGKTLGNVDVDAKLGRQVSAAIRILQERKQANLLAPVVVVHMGNNGTFSARQFDEMMALLKDVRRVVFVNDKVPRKWQEPNNTALSEGVKRYPNTVLVDWNAASISHPEWFWSDGIHLRPEGAAVYASLIAASIKP